MMKSSNKLAPEPGRNIRFRLEKLVLGPHDGGWVTVMQSESFEAVAPFCVKGYRILHMETGKLIGPDGRWMK